MITFGQDSIEGAELVRTIRHLDNLREQLDEDELELLEECEKLRSKIVNTCDVQVRGVTLILEDKMEDLVRDQMEDAHGVDAIGFLDPYLDWKHLTQDVTSDYTSFEFGPNTYYARL